MEENWKKDIPWDDILFEIQSGQCVLVVGPDLVEFENKQTLFQTFSRELENNEDVRNQLDIPVPQYFFGNEELLQLQGRGGETKLYTFYKNFYAQRSEFDKPFEKIAQLPFHLIISLLPDKRLPQKFEQQNLPYHFSYYPRTNNPAPSVEKPSAEKPLIYNILGVIDPPDMVITFDHLFLYLQGILGSRPLPLPILTTLQDARSFLFLGVHFEKWYMQMLLRLFLTGNKSNDELLKYSLLRTADNTEACTFIARRLKLKFLSIDPLHFLDELHLRTIKKGNLKQGIKKNVFISYSHDDKDIATQLYQALDKAGTLVTLDDVSMPAGKQIRGFMEIVRKMDAIVIVVSKNSLISPWVGKEMSIAIENGVRIIPCHLDNRFLENSLGDDTVELVRSKLREINQLITKRKDSDPLDGVQDLTEDEDLWREFGRKTPDLIAHLRGSKSISLLQDNLLPGIQSLVDNVLARVSHE